MESNGTKITKLLEVMAMLRHKEHGCAWDLKQNFKTIAPHTLEECYEVIDCIEQDDINHLPEELGDLLFQVVFYSQIAAEEGLFKFDDVCESITTKLLTRHPHVFPDATTESFGKENELSPEQVEANWEKIKQEERAKASKLEGEPSLLADVPIALPAILRANKLQNRAATGGFDWHDTSNVIEKINEEMEELKEAMANNDKAHIEEEFGDLLFSIVNLSRHLKLNPESSLRSANDKFSQRFMLIESMLHEQNIEMKSLSLDELEAYWRLAKQKHTELS